MYLIDFVGDVLRFGRNGILSHFLWLLFVRLEVVIYCIAIVGGMLIFHSPRDRVLIALLALAAAAWVFLMYTIQFLSPLYFGSFVVGRLQTKARPSEIIATIYDEFLLFPSRETVYVTYFLGNDFA
jgi:hypothetical protein